MSIAKLDIANLVSFLSTNSNGSVSIDYLFATIFVNSLRLTSPEAMNQFVSHIQELCNLFHVDLNKPIGAEQFNYIRNMDLSSIMLSCISLVNILKLLENDTSKIKMDKETTIELSFRIIVFAIFYPMTLNNAEFIAFLRSPNGRILVIEVLNFLYLTIQNSQLITDTMEELINDIGKLFKNGFKCCPCIKKQESSSSSNIDKLNKLVEIKNQNLQTQKLNAQIFSLQQKS